MLKSLLPKMYVINKKHKLKKIDKNIFVGHKITAL